MNSLPSYGLSLLAVISFACLGCNDSGTGYKTAEELRKEKPATGADDKDDHDHAHEHGDHEHKAPHGGALAELGEHAAHVEIVIDEDSGKITAYILDAHAENPLAADQRELALVIAEHDEHEHAEPADKKEEAKPAEEHEKPLELKLTAEGEADKPATVFVGQSDKLKGHHHNDVTISEITVGGKPYKNVAVHAHGHDE